jgi:hypothetical protein
MKFVITEKERKEIKDMYLIEQTESKPTDNQFSELIGKSATFKNDDLDIIVKGEIMKVLTGDKTKHRDGVLIVFKYLAVTKILSGDYTTNADMSNAIFDCNKQIFHIRVLPAGNKNPVYLEFTCEGLSDVLIQMSPCKTDFAMTDINIPNNFA